MTELYALEQDPHEQHNLAHDAQFAAIRSELAARLLRWMDETDDPLLRGPVASPFYHESLNTLKTFAGAAS